jgi:hypothetical protein
MPERVPESAFNESVTKKSHEPRSMFCSDGISEYLLSQDATPLREDLVDFFREYDVLLSRPNPSLKSYLDNRIMKVLNDSDLQNELTDYSGAKMENFVSVEDFKNKIDQLPEGVLYQFAIKCREVFQDECKQLLEKFKEAVVNYKNKLTEAVRKNILPAIALQNIDRLDNALSIDFIDPFDDILDNNRLGSHGQRRVGFSTKLIENLKSFEHVAFHELSHMLSGKTLIKSEGSIFERKVGLVLKTEHTKQFTWINEAATEYLAQKLSGNNIGSYEPELEKLHHLIAKGLDPDLLWSAYFENILDEDVRSGTHGQHYKNLIKAIDQIEGTHAYNKLNHEFNMLDIENILMQKHCILDSEDLDDLREDYNHLVITITSGSNPKSSASRKYIRIAPDNADSAYLERILKGIELDIQSTPVADKIKLSHSFVQKKPNTIPFL